MKLLNKHQKKEKYWLRRPECQLLAEGGTRGDRACSLPIGETHLYHHGQGLEDVLKNKT